MNALMTVIDRILFVPLSCYHVSQVRRLFVDNYEAMEPLFKALHITTEEIQVVFDLQFVTMLDHSCSYIAIDPIVNKVVAFSLAYIKERDKPRRIPPELQQSEIADKIATFRRFVYSLLSDQNELEKIPDASKTLITMFTFADEGYREQGIMTRLLEITFNAGKRVGIKYASAVASSCWKQKLLVDLHFRVIKTIAYRDYLDADGHQVFSNLGNDLHTNAMWLVRKL